jgi:hypothetical protein
VVELVGAIVVLRWVSGRKVSLEEKEMCDA